MPYNPATTSHPTLQNNRILIVDDASINRELIMRYLAWAGFHNIEYAIDGEDALEKVKSFDPDLVILDLVMPKMDGLEVMRQLRSEAIYSQLPIIVQTSISDPDERITAWEVGATDVITKPIHKSELISRVRVQLENSYLISQLERYQTATKLDIEQALEVQSSLLPTAEEISELKDDKNLLLEYLFIPSRFLSGDMWGMISHKNDDVVVWIADFTGKGIRAALNTFRLHTLIQESQALAYDPKSFLEALNLSLCDLLPTGQFATFWVGVIDQENEIIRYASASSTHPLIYNPKDRTYSSADGTGLPLGVDKNFKYDLRTIPFPKGSSLILYSDMLWEDDGLVGISLLPEKLDDLIKEIKGRSIIEIIREQMNLVGNVSLPDDLTLIEIRHNK